jgi:Cu/Ag efflux protein CusF
MKLKLALIALSAALATLSAHADERHHQGALVEGEVRKVDKDAKKITLKHDPMPSLDMPAMTMVFQVKDSAMLDEVKAGDKVKFEAQKLGGAYTITRIMQLR